MAHIHAFDGDATNILTLGYYQDGAPQALSGAGAVTVTEYLTEVTTTGADALTLADGLVEGQLKKIQMVVDGGVGTLTPANFLDGTTVTFADAGDFVILQWQTSSGTDGWRLVDKGNLADGATAPAVA